jgi:hypothetical protein
MFFSGARLLLRQYNSWASLPPRGPVCPLVGQCAPSWASVAPSWASVAPSWASVPPRGPVCPLVGQSAPSWASVAPSWASVVRDGTCSGNPPAQRDDFFRLYERCVASGLRARVEIRNCSGFQEITLSCRLQATPHAIGAPRARRRRRRRRRRGSEYPLPEHPPASPPTLTRLKSPTALNKQAVCEKPLPVSLGPEHSPDLSSNPSPPPAK